MSCCKKRPNWGVMKEARTVSSPINLKKGLLQGTLELQVSVVENIKCDQENSKII